MAEYPNEHRKINIRKEARWKRVIQMVLAISLTALLRFEMFSEWTNGFGIALDVVVLGIIIYISNGFSVPQITGIAAVASPVFRMIVIFSANGDLALSALRALPDAAFFAGYGIVYILVLKLFFMDDSSMGPFIIAVFSGDFIGNMCELFVRTILNHQNAYSYQIVGLALFAAAVRTIMVFCFVLIMENYYERKIKEDKLREYGKLVDNATVILDEIRIMEKNMDEVEDAMKRGYDLYRELDAGDYPAETAGRALELAKLTHEIKGDYRNVMSVLGSLYDEELLNRTLSIAEIIELEQSNAEAHICGKGYDIKLETYAESGLYVKQCYRLMSVIRNLITNSIEAICDENRTEHNTKQGVIRITARRETPCPDDGGIFCRLDVSDNGPGITAKRESNIFVEGYSTKFNTKTGYIQRGLGLPVVKDYVENDLKGTIELLHDQEQGAHFRIIIPAEVHAEDR